MKKESVVYLYWMALVSAVTIVVICYISYNDPFSSLRPHVTSIHVINLDKDVKRWTALDAIGKGLPIVPVRWPAFYGKDHAEEDLKRRGIGYVITRAGTGSYSAQFNKNVRNLGAVGCYLSHKYLLEHLATLSVPGTHGHLILEDDVAIPRNFLHPSDEWHKHCKNVPTDWDIVFFDITSPRGTYVHENIMKLAYVEDKGNDGNWGTHAYLVKHSSIRDKLLPWLEHMVDAIDEQYKMKFNEWNVYCILPGILPLNSELSKVSSIAV